MVQRIRHRHLQANKAFYAICLVVVALLFTFILNTIPYENSVFSKVEINGTFLNAIENSWGKSEYAVTKSKKANAELVHTHLPRSKSPDKKTNKDMLQSYQARNSKSSYHNSYKIEMDDDTGSDFQNSPLEYSITLLKESIEQTHKAALQYLSRFHLTTKAPNKVIYSKDKAHLNTQEYEPSVTPTTSALKREISPRQKNVKSQINYEEIKQNIVRTKSLTNNSLQDNEFHSISLRTTMAPCNCSRIIKPNFTPYPNTKWTETQILQKINATFGDSTCNDWATMRGYNQKVISYSLFGKFLNEYYNNTPSIITQISSMYPGWIVRIYHDLNLGRAEEKEWVCSLICEYSHVDFCFVKNLTGGLGDISWTIGSVWRISVLGDPLVTQYLIRDMDSPILQREVTAVNDWLWSHKCFHFMRDNIMHNQPIMAGMWGGCNSFYPDAMPRLRNTVFRWSNKSVSHYSRDQINFSLLLWPTFKKNHTAHDAYSCREYPASRPFPTKRVNFTFIGMRTSRKKYAHDEIKTPCPVQCRPPNHKDWTFC
ncbi:uncharacterized protein [Palaemon carinicauda]|uniref:uncharacterized protein n=1 Tax=Palaemon carinicauda TaxID=392227 RepID=UPI0035B5F930